MAAYFLRSATPQTLDSQKYDLQILQKTVMRVMTFSKFHEHYSPIFKHLHIVKRPDLVFLNIAVFMYKIHKHYLCLMLC